MKGMTGWLGTWSLPPEMVIFCPEAGTVGLALGMRKPPSWARIIGERMARDRLLMHLHQTTGGLPGTML